MRLTIRSRSPRLTPVAAAARGTVTDMDETDPLHDDENIRDEGEEYQDDEERDRD
ncbi:hypothetical protein MFTT_34280 [Mycolicibacterium fortuitum subsp. fortuitum]|nr:hypothetical protein MFTT_34280 [Mycolicibacterium fortuitum subsp. fortuitum]